MCACEPVRRPRSAGFSLVELLVAVVFTSILMGGMYKVFTANVSVFATALETSGMQRNARWALSLLQNDIQQAGYLMPPRLVTELATSTQPPLMIETSATAVTVTRNDGTTESIGAPDELQVVMDVPLPTQATIASATAAGGTSLSCTFASGKDLVHAGDVVWIKDSAMELFVASAAPGSTGTVAFATGASLLDDYGNNAVNPLISGQLMKAHKAGAEVAFIRPMQVVSYTIQPLALDPASSTATVPCLVRRTRTVGSTTWGNAELIMEGVTSFKLDWSLDGGHTWVRQANNLTASQWAAIRTATSNAFTTLASTSPLAAALAGGMSSTADPFWFNYATVLLKIDVETRTQTRRTEYAGAANQAAYRTRRETLFVSPRNFALGAP
ncbi:MAG TPA: prepilin-type N-terminal cleavage/methylation domain-containing protein [Holophaga sp.]|nr:prepilin-type N-terminal cleavage/methylation domain-containing protein [Holophaga sp.]